MSEDITPAFVAFGKIPRLNREIVVTEKIDGTNAQILITEDGGFRTGSRNRWITPGKSTDNHGFAQWAHERKDDLIKGLGVGQHYGEWYGRGIQRGYDLDEKRFALFNTKRWNAENTPLHCEVVPVIARGNFESINLNEVMAYLRDLGSYAAPGYMNPEGIVIFHTASQKYYKKTLENDASPKSAVTPNSTSKLTNA